MRIELVIKVVNLSEPKHAASETLGLAKPDGGKP